MTERKCMYCGHALTEWRALFEGPHYETCIAYDHWVVESAKYPATYKPNEGALVKN